ncbi:MAG: DUF6788 family protein [Patescibacteria group bacterium]|nr:DUF6788 family protein [Patescibacteria group bacterium]
MKHKRQMSKKERRERSLAAKIISSEPFIQGSLFEMARVCGKATCKCSTKGEKHVSLYLTISRDKKKRMIYIPKRLEKQAQEMVKAYQKTKKSMAIVSDNCLKELIQAKKDLLEKDA